MSRREPAAVRLYRAALAIFPARIRRAHGDEMAAMFEAAWGDARARGRGAALAQAVRSARDLTLNGIAARLADLTTKRRDRSAHDHHRIRRGGGGQGMDTALQNLRHSLRGFARRPGFTFIAVLTLGLGIGGTTAIFSIVSALLLRPLPYARPDQLVTVNHYYPSLDGLEASVSARGYRDYRNRTHTFSSVAVETVQAKNLTGDGEPERISTAAVSPQYFGTLGVPASVGRSFGVEVENGDANVVVVSDGFWLRRFGGSPDAVGRTLDLDGVPYTVVGVMPAGFRDVFSRDVQLWVPLILTEEQYSRGYTNEFLSAVARVAPGLGVRQAAEEMAAFAETLKQDESLRLPSDWSIKVTGLQERATRDVRPALLVLLGAVLLVLLIACANVANLLLTRASGQRRQIAVRLAMGASRAHVISRLLADGIVLGLAGAIVGLLIADWGLGGLRAVAASTVPAVGDASLDRTVLVFTLVVSVVTGAFISLMPAFGAWHTDVSRALREGVRAGDDRAGLRLRRSFVVAQLALSLALLAGAGLLLKSVARLQAVSPGFDPKGVMTFFVSLPPSAYPDGDAQRQFYDDLLPSLRRVPGVTSAGLDNVLPFSALWATSSFAIVGREMGPDEPYPWGDFRIVSPGFQDALKLPLVEGRFFTDADGPETPMVAVVDEELARRYWPQGGAIGQRISYGGPDEIEIVGVVAHAAHEGLDADPRAQVYVSYRQRPQRGMFVVARASGRPEAILPGLRAAVRAADPNIPLARVSTMERLVDESMGNRRLSLVLLAVFAAVALTLAATGVYGVMAQVVGQRTRELGVRMAMGAKRSDVLALVMRQGMALVAIGVALGLVGSLTFARVLRGQLFGVEPTDPSTFALVVVVLLASAALATLVPALRATRVDPVVALRDE